MCRNHSHLKIEEAWSDGSLSDPRLVFVLADSTITLEAASGSKLLIPTSGLLYVPFGALAGSSVSDNPAPVEKPSLSLCYMTAPEPIMSRTPILGFRRYVMPSAPA